MKEYHSLDDVLGEVAAVVPVELYQALSTFIERDAQENYNIGYSDGYSTGFTACSIED